MVHNMWLPVQQFFGVKGRARGLEWSKREEILLAMEVKTDVPLKNDGDNGS